MKTVKKNIKHISLYSHNSVVENMYRLCKMCSRDLIRQIENKSFQAEESLHAVHHIAPWSWWHQDHVRIDFSELGKHWKDLFIQCVSLKAKKKFENRRYNKIDNIIRMFNYLPIKIYFSEYSIKDSKNGNSEEKWWIRIYRWW